jgi:threonine/homoserine/homoserine lactone efflux protein
MEDLIATAGALIAAALTPGPNNFVVMRAAARSGLIGALPEIAGIVLGSLALLAVVVAGAGAVFEAEPRLEPALAVAGCLYLVALGVRLLASGGGSHGEPGEEAALPAGAAGLFAFQFLNPKSWVLVLTVTAAAPAGGGPLAGFAQLAPLFVTIPAACLLLWSAFGSAMARHLERRPLRVGLDRTLGALLIVSALLLLTSTWPPLS